MYSGYGEGSLRKFRQTRNITCRLLCLFRQKWRLHIKLVKTKSPSPSTSKTNKCVSFPWRISTHKNVLASLHTHTCVCLYMNYEQWTYICLLCRSICCWCIRMRMWMWMKGHYNLFWIVVPAVIFYLLCDLGCFTVYTTYT